MAAKLRIFVLSHFNFGVNFKKHFPKGFFFNEVLLITGDHEYFNITEIYIYFFLFRWGFRGKTFFSHPHANLN